MVEPFAPSFDKKNCENNNRQKIASKGLALESRKSKQFKFRMWYVSWYVYWRLYFHILLLFMTIFKLVRKSMAEKKEFQTLLVKNAAQKLTYLLDCDFKVSKF